MGVKMKVFQTRIKNLNTKDRPLEYIANTFFLISGPILYADMIKSNRLLELNRQNYFDRHPKTTIAVMWVLNIGMYATIAVDIYNRLK